MSLLINPYRFGAGGAAPATYADEVAADSPVAWWRFEETSGSTVADEIGTSDATNYGPNLDVAGQVGSGASFDGTDDWMQADPVNLTTALTLEAIIKRDGQGRIITRGTTTSGSTQQWQMFLLDNRLCHQSNGMVGVSPFFSRSADTVPSGVWVHVAVTWSTTDNGGLARFYIDGEDAGVSQSITVTSPLSDVGASVNIGCLGQGGSQFYDGDLDEPAVYDKVLSASRILAHAQAAGLA